jgi:uncharacterized membrane protein YdjX (TVP38/TMEM64 family)
MRRRLLLLALIALLLGLFLSGSFERFEVEALRSWIRGARVWGPVVYVLLFSALEPVGFPGLIFMLAAIAVWPAWQAWLLIWAGAVGAGAVGFALARTLARDWVAARQSARMQRLDAWVAANALLAVIGVRLAFFLMPWAHWALGLSRVRFRTLLLGSLIGFAPGSAFVAFAGAGAVDWLAEQSSATWGVVAALLLVSALVVRFVRARRRHALGTASD